MDTHDPKIFCIVDKNAIFVQYDENSDEKRYSSTASRAG